MKAKNGLLVFVISLILISCFDAPEFSTTPAIKLEDIYFGKNKRLDKPDSLVITVRFEDGEGDLGLDDRYLKDPHHQYNYFIATDANTLLKVTSSQLVPGYYELNIPQGVRGTIAVTKTRRNELFENQMVAFSPAVLCSHYSNVSAQIPTDSVLVKEEFLDLIDPDYSPFPRKVTHEGNAYYVVKDTFYLEPNPNFYNIDVHFLRKTGVNQFEELDFKTISSCLSFNSRFPVLTDKENPLSGEIKYSMTSSDLENIMGNNIWKLRVIIRDRALNVSRPVESKEFTLEEIKR